jgi:hypothetical protein
MVHLVNPRIISIKHGPLSYEEALLLVAEERNAGMLLPLMEPVPDELTPQTWKGIELDEPAE